MTEGKKIGLQIKGMRKQCGFTQEKVANDLFISQSYLRKIEHGEANPSVNMVAKITSYLENALSGADKRRCFNWNIGSISSFRKCGSIRSWADTIHMESRYIQIQGSSYAYTMLQQISLRLRK